MLNKTRSFFATFPLLIQRTIYHGIDSERRSQSDCKICEGTFEDLYWFPISTLWTVLLHMTEVFTVFFHSIIIWDLFQIIYTLIYLYHHLHFTQEHDRLAKIGQRTDNLEQEVHSWIPPVVSAEPTQQKLAKCASYTWAKEKHSSCTP